MSFLQPQIKGSIAVGSTVGAAASVASLPVGADGTVLTADSTTPSGLKYAAASGFQGNQGNQGNAGAQGAQGAQGNQGLEGSQGNQGNQGFQGSAGPQGNQGFQGLQGPQGNQGNQGPSQAGVQGPQGSIGPQGSTGPSSITESAGPVSLTTTFASVISVTPAAGTYMVWFVSWANNVSATTRVDVRISFGGSAVTNSLKEADDNGAAEMIVNTIARVTVNGSQSIDGEARYVGGTTADLNNIQLMVSLTS